MTETNEKKLRKRNRDYNEYKSNIKGEFSIRFCLRCDKKTKMRKQYRLCVRCRERSSIYAMEDHSIIM